MNNEELIIRMFCTIDDRMRGVPKHPQASLYPSEIVTLACLFALKGKGTRAFYRWIEKNYAPLFPKLPHRTRLFRLFAAHLDWSERLLADPTVFGVIDAYGIEFIHPIREGRSDRQIGKKGISNHRWIVGGKLCLLLNKWGFVVGWDCDTANVSDTTFQPLIREVEDQMIVLSDTAFHAKEGDPSNLKLCPKGQWNDRMIVETVLSMLTVVCQFKHMRHWAWSAVKAHLAFGMGLFNLLTQWYGFVVDETGFFKLSIAEFSL
jgi:hypothetical protein